jgi:putative Mg2+ transporter-C (MgtC) family protein
VSQAIENVLRLLLAAALGGLIGFERERNEQPAGLRTNILVAVGSCLFTLMSAYGVDAVIDDLDSPTRFDPSRVVSQIVVGIGFLGAGAIIKHGFSVRGLTTAASLWVVAAIGAAAALGSYDLAIAATAVSLFALFALRPARRWVHRLGSDREEITVEADPSVDVQAVLEAVRAHGVSDLTLGIDVDSEGTRTIAVVASFPSSEHVDRVLSALASVPGVRAVTPSEP